MNETHSPNSSGPDAPDQGAVPSPTTTPPLRSESAPGRSGSPDLSPALTRLSRVRTIAKGLLITQRLGWIVAAAIAAVVVGGTLDYFLRAPGWLRGLGLVLALGVLWIVVVRRVVPALSFRPSLEDLALRLEGTPEGRQAGLAGWLASGVGLSRPDPHASAVSGALAHQVVASAGARFGAVRASRLLQPGPAMRAAGIMLFAGVAAMGLVVTEPALSFIGARRMLLPWTDAQWPKRTLVSDLATVRHHPLGTAMLLQAALVDNTPGGAGSARDASVEARYRLVIDGVAGPIRSLAMSNQGRSALVNLRDALGVERTAGGTVYERLIESSALSLAPASPSRAGGDRAESAAIVAAPPEVQLEYWFLGGDDQTAPRRVRLVQPPAVVGATLDVEPPAYMKQATGAAPSVMAMGPGNDERATAQGVLAGSRVTLTLALSKDLPLPAGNSTAQAAWLRSTMGEAFAGLAGKDDSGFLSKLDARNWSFTWTLREPARIPVRLVDEFGITSADEVVYRVEARADRAPEATIVKPGEDIDVLPSARVEVVAEARDDIALGSIAAEARVARRTAGSVGAAPEPVGEPAVLQSAVPAPTAPARTLSVTTTITPEDLKAGPGDEVWLTALAKDVFELDGVRHDAVRSQVRKVRVISPEQLVEQLWQDLSAVRRGAMKTAEQQDRSAKSLAEKTDAAAKDPGDAAKQNAAKTATDAAAREQAAITEQANRLAEAVNKAQERAKANNLPDRDLADLMKGAKETLQQAGDASSKGTQQLQEVRQSQAQSKDPSKTSQEQQAAQQAAQRQTDEARKDQDAVEKALEQAANLLDRGQDAWSSRRSLERLVSEQQEAREQTRKLGQQTTGKKPEELSTQQRQQAESLAQKQEELSRRTEEAIRKMQEQSKNLQESDPNTASALQQAAQRGQRSAVAEQMQQTAQQIRQNKQNDAQQQQQRAEDTLKNMLNELKDAQKNRDAVLKRELASLIQSIEALIAQQTAALEQLKTARDKNTFGGLDAPMIRLHAATLDTTERARTTGKEAREAATMLRAAADAQTSAITTLRTEPVDGEQADRNENLSLENLKRARDEAGKAKEQAEQRDQDRQRAELRQAYADLLTAQTGINDETQVLMGQPADRRTRQAAAALAIRQTEVQTRARELLEKNEDLGKSQVFPIAHERIDQASGAAADLLKDARLTGVLRWRQTTVANTLRALVDALADEQEKKDDFRENEQEGGGGGGGDGNGPPPLIPDIAELTALKKLQQEAMSATRQAAEANDPALTQAAVGDATSLQQRIADKARQIQQKMMQKPGGGGGGGGGG